MNFPERFIMKKSLIIASMLGLFAASSFAQTPAPAAAEPVKASAPAKHAVHKAHKAKKAAAHKVKKAHAAASAASK
jgi:hypothetical protein